MGRIVFSSGRTLGQTDGAFVIAEAGVNHNGDLGLARALVDAAAAAGADAVKFQTFKTRRLVTDRAPQARYQAERAAATSQSAMLRRLELSPEAHADLRDYARARGLVFFSSPFDEESVDLLVDLGVDVLKLGSGELTNAPLLRHVAATGLPLILSTGMAWLSEVLAAVELLRAAGLTDLAVLQCTSRYPAPLEDAHVRAMGTLAAALGPDVLIGYSDHTPGAAAPAAAAALGARILEKHLTLDNALPGPDHAASLDPSAFAAMVTLVRQVETALGDREKRPRPGEDEMRQVARRGLHLARPVPAGTPLEAADLIALRPADGLPPSALESVVGLVAARDLAPGDALHLGDVVRPAPRPEPPR